MPTEITRSTNSHAHPTEGIAPVVPIVGTGFNRWLLSGTEPSPVLTDWWALVRSVAYHEGLLPNPDLETRLRRDGDPTFAWESIVVAATESLARASEAGCAATRPKRASAVEDSILANLTRRIRDEANRLVVSQRVKDNAIRFSRALTREWTLRADVVSLNADGIFESALRSSVAGGRALSVHREQLADDPSSAEDLKVWYPHGSTDATSPPVLGVQRYSNAQKNVVNGFKRYKKWEVGWRKLVSAREVRVAERERVRDQRSWVSASLVAPLLLLGVGLGRSEVDIWTFLHLRARNLANVDPARRPKIYRLTCDDERADDRAHWESLSQAIPITPLKLGSDWHESWSLLLDLLGAGRLPF